LTGVARSKLPEKLEVLWTYDAFGPVGSTAAIVAGVVYVGTSDEQVLALSLADGAKRWEYKTSGGVRASPCVAGGAVYIGDGSGTFHSIDAATGEGRWTFKSGAEITSSANVTADGRSVLFGSYDGHLYCLDAADGELRWKLKTEAPVHCGPSLVGDPVAAAVAGCDGKLRLVGVADGVEKAALGIGGNISASPVFDGERLYVGTLGKVMLAADAAGKEVLWRREPKGAGQFYGCAAVHLGRVIFPGRDKNVRCVDAESGEELWSFGARGGVDSSPVIVAGPTAAQSRVIFGCTTGKLYSLSLDDGTLGWIFDAGSPVSASPAVAEGRLVIGVGDGGIYCFGEKE